MSATDPAAKKSRYLLTDWNPNDESKWDSKLAWRTLWITTYSLILAFCVWFLPSAIAPKLTLLGFDLNKSQLYWLTALPGLAAGIRRADCQLALERVREQLASGVLHDERARGPSLPSTRRLSVQGDRPGTGSSQTA